MHLKFIQNIKGLSFAFPFLMLSPQEQSREIKTPDDIPGKVLCVTLRGMITQNENAWSLWIDDEKLTSAKRTSKFHPLTVVKVGDQMATFKIQNAFKSYAVRDSFNPTTGENCK